VLQYGVRPQQTTFTVTQPTAGSSWYSTVTQDKPAALRHVTLRGMNGNKCVYQLIFVSAITPISGSSNGSTILVSVIRHNGLIAKCLLPVIQQGNHCKTLRQPEARYADRTGNTACCRQQHTRELLFVCVRVRTQSRTFQDKQHSELKDSHRSTRPSCAVCFINIDTLLFPARGATVYWTRVIVRHAIQHTSRRR
jgi:hypothetical protein